MEIRASRLSSVASLLFIHLFPAVLSLFGLVLSPPVPLVLLPHVLVVLPPPAPVVLLTPVLVLSPPVLLQRCQVRSRNCVINTVRYLMELEN